MPEYANNSLPAFPASLNTLNEAMSFASSRTTFEIKKARLYNDGKDEGEVYLVALRGTNRSFDRTDVLGLHVVLMSGLSKNNIYYEEVKKAMIDTIPEGAKAVLIGHSLGGMIAQQIGADADINAKYDVLDVVAIGSPFVKTEGRTCPLHRFADKADLVPWLGRAFKANFKTAKPVFISNGYFGRPVLAHTDSYRKSESWTVYDCFGELNGKHTIVFAE